MLLGIASGAIEEVKHFSLLVFKVVGIHLKFPFHLEPPTFEGRIYSIQ
jgi:hypothetical protein